jgi:hypothetical protein
MWGDGGRGEGGSQTYKSSGKEGRRLQSDSHTGLRGSLAGDELSGLKNEGIRSRIVADTAGTESALVII